MDGLVELKAIPGIQRDGTALDSLGRWTDGQWVRFFRGRPLKINGFTQIASTANGPVTQANSWSRAGLTYTHLFSVNGVESFTINNSTLAVSAFNNRTPGGYSGTLASSLWQAATIYDTANSKPIIVACDTNSLNAIDGNTAGSVYSGDPSSASALTTISGLSVSGGVCALPTYLLAYGSDGYLAWSNENDPTNFTTGSSGSKRFGGSKIVKAMPLANAVGPAALLWALDSVMRLNWVGGSAVFRATTLSPHTTILSTNGVEEHNGVFYWPGIDRFFSCDGSSVSELPNDTSLRWFFSNLNMQYRQAVWSLRVPAYGEIWWFFPDLTSSGQCNRAIIYNVREKCWYDAMASRCAGTAPQVLPYPLAVNGTKSPVSGLYNIYLHEFGYDGVEDGITSAINSYITSPVIGANAEQGVRNWTNLWRVEPDMVASGNIGLTVLANEFAQSSNSNTTSAYMTSATEHIDITATGRQLRVQIGSNSAGGFFNLGKTMLGYDQIDKSS